MAIKISNLPVQTLNNMSATDVIPITDAESNITRKVAVSVLTQHIANNATGFTGSTGIVSPLTFGNGTAGYIGSAANPVASFNGTVPVTAIIDKTVVATLTDEQTLTNKTLTSPIIGTTFTLQGANITTYTPFPDVTIAAAACDVNAYQEFSLQNLNGGSDASADLVLYNDAADVNSFFIDMGINSSGFNAVDYPLFTANSGYIFTGGGSGGGGSQPSNLFIGTSSPNSDIVFFTEGVDTANRVMIISHTGNLLLGTTNDNLQHILQVVGDVSIGGHIMPDQDASHDLGEPGVRWKSLHLNSPDGIQMSGGYQINAVDTYITCAPSVDTVIKTSALTNVGSMRLVVQIEGDEDGDATGRHIQTCDVTVIRRVNASSVVTVDSVVYGVIYTSVAPIATVDARWNALAGVVEVTARPVSTTNSVYVKAVNTEISRYI